MKSRVKSIASETAEWPAILREYVIVAAVYSAFAALTFIVARFSWWTAVALLVLFGFAVASRLVMVALVLLMEGIVVRLSVGLVRMRGLHPSAVDSLFQQARSIFWLNLIAGLTEGYLVMLTILLAFAISW